jgi:hypothetical protein
MRPRQPPSRAHLRTYCGPKPMQAPGGGGRAHRTAQPRRRGRGPQQHRTTPPTCSSGSTNQVSMKVIQYRASQNSCRMYGLVPLNECAMSMGSNTTARKPSSLQGGRGKGRTEQRHSLRGARATTAAGPTLRRRLRGKTHCTIRLNSTVEATAPVVPGVRSVAWASVELTHECPPWAGSVGPHSVPLQRPPPRALPPPWCIARYDR